MKRKAPDCSVTEEVGGFLFKRLLPSDAGISMHGGLRYFLEKNRRKEGVLRRYEVGGDRMILVVSLKG